MLCKSMSLQIFSSPRIRFSSYGLKHNLLYTNPSVYFLCPCTLEQLVCCLCPRLGLTLHQTLNSLCFSRTRYKAFYSSLYSQQVNTGQGQALNKHLWNKHTQGRKTIWSRVHLQSLLGKLLLKRGLESDCSSSKLGARVNRTHISIMTLTSACYLLNPGKPARTEEPRSSLCS